MTRGAAPTGGVVTCVECWWGQVGGGQVAMISRGADGLLRCTIEATRLRVSEYTLPSMGECGPSASQEGTRMEHMQVPPPSICRARGLKRLSLVLPEYLSKENGNLIWNNSTLVWIATIQHVFEVSRL